MADCPDTRVALARSWIVNGCEEHMMGNLEKNESMDAPILARRRASPA